jgi:hypothetical protein
MRTLQQVRNAKPKQKMKQKKQQKKHQKNSPQNLNTKYKISTQNLGAWSSEFKLLMGVSSFGIVLILVVFLKLFGAKASSLTPFFGSSTKSTTFGRTGGSKVA